MDRKLQAAMAAKKKMMMPTPVPTPMPMKKDMNREMLNVGGKKKKEVNPFMKA